ncbi:nuclear transport factor 2 family protein [Microbacterium sp. MM2322]|jgi:hypothetical protein|uniref:nuclear transport factor 2 family protein n=1 Tax=Microbacterium sp. MM2322 TaxID=3157631 RepID=UPI0032D583DC
MRSLSPDDLVQTYLRALSYADAELAASLFTPDGVVDSPLYGMQAARDFYPALFADTASSVLTLRKTLVSADAATVAFWFDFDWVLANGTPAPFTVVDVAEIGEDGLITRLHIVYDTHPIRESWVAQNEG